jgi:phosphoglycerate dehydrogenase-like enzyme
LRPLRVVLGEWQDDPAFRDAVTAPVEWIPTRSLRDEDVVPLLPGADALISKRFTPAMGRAANALRLIQITGAGTNQIDFAAVPPGTVVCNARGHGDSIAEYVLMMLLSLNRDLVRMDRRLRAGDWSDRWPRGPHRDLKGRTLLLIGYGVIGQAVARVVAPLGMRIIAVTRNPKLKLDGERSGVEHRGFGELRQRLSEADFVVVAVPLNAETEGLIGATEFAAMRDDAYLINVARGDVVDERALYDALQTRSIAGAAIDVWYRYPATGEGGPAANLPFHELDNVLMTPHIAGWTTGTFAHLFAVIDQNLHRLINDEPLLNVVFLSEGGARQI